MKRATSVRYVACSGGFDGVPMQPQHLKPLERCCPGALHDPHTTHSSGLAASSGMRNVTHASARRAATSVAAADARASGSAGNVAADAAGEGVIIAPPGGAAIAARGMSGGTDDGDSGGALPADSAGDDCTRGQYAGTTRDLGSVQPMVSSRRVAILPPPLPPPLPARVTSRLPLTVKLAFKPSGDDEAVAAAAAAVEPPVPSTFPLALASEKRTRRRSPPVSRTTRPRQRPSQKAANSGIQLL